MGIEYEDIPEVTEVSTKLEDLRDIPLGSVGDDLPIVEQNDWAYSSFAY